MRKLVKGVGVALGGSTLLLVAAWLTDELQYRLIERRVKRR